MGDIEVSTWLRYMFFTLRFSPEINIGMSCYSKTVTSGHVNSFLTHQCECMIGTSLSASIGRLH